MPKKDPFALKYKFIRDANGKRKRIPVGADESVERGLASSQIAVVREAEDQIVALYMEGVSIKDIAQKLKIASSAIYNLKARDERFSQKLDRARASRGFVFEEKALEVAEKVQGESSEEVAAARLKTDVYKWAAKVNNPNVHGDKTQITTATPTIIMIDTGFREDPIEVVAGPALPVEDA